MLEDTPGQNLPGSLEGPVKGHPVPSGHMETGSESQEGKSLGQGMENGSPQLGPCSWKGEAKEKFIATTQEQPHGEVKWEW